MDGEKFPSEEPFINIGEAVSEWKTNEKHYEKIQGILVDTRFLMNSYKSKSTIHITKLAKAIKYALEE